LIENFFCLARTNKNPLCLYIIVKNTFTFINTLIAISSIWIMQKIRNDRYLFVNDDFIYLIKNDFPMYLRH